MLMNSGDSNTILWVLGTAVANLVVFIVFDFWKNRGNKIGALTKSIDLLRAGFNAFVGDSMSGKLKNASDYMVSKSPIQLNKAGEKLARDSGVTAYLDKNSHKYFDRVRREGVADILNSCRAVASRALYSPSEADIVKMKKHFSNEGISQLILQEIFAIKLRDAYQAKYKPRKPNTQNN